MMSVKQQKLANLCIRRLYGLLYFFILMGFMGGCAVAPKKLFIKDLAASYDQGTIIATQTKAAVSFEDLMADLSRVRVIYVGEQHHDPAHHKIQLDIIKAVFKTHPDIAVGMEMFDQTYQPILNLWSAGELDQASFLEKAHWYANWKFDFDMYKDILEFIREKKLRLIGLNIPFHIPPKIAVGGLSNLSASDKKHLPEDIDTSNNAHRAYVEQIFKFHHVRGRANFEYFYEAQCVWEDTMASAVARNIENGKMVVLAGNGHIIRKFGIPDRAFRRTGAAFRTICPATVGSEIESDYADYIWVTPARKSPKTIRAKTDKKRPR